MEDTKNLLIYFLSSSAVNWCNAVEYVLCMLKQR